MFLGKSCLVLLKRVCRTISGVLRRVQTSDEKSFCARFQATNLRCLSAAFRALRSTWCGKPILLLKARVRAFPDVLCAIPMGSCLSAASSSSKDPAVDEPSAYFAKLSIEYLIMFSQFSFCYILFLFIAHDS